MGHILEVNPRLLTIDILWANINDKAYFIGQPSLMEVRLFHEQSKCLIVVKCGLQIVLDIYDMN